MNLDVTEADLPANFRNKIVGTEGDKMQIRSSVTSLTDIKTWVREFGLRTNTSWIVRLSQPKETTKLLCKKKYVCHHSQFNKSKNKSVRNCNCPAYILIAVKLTTINTRKRDKYVKEGLPAKIFINLKHSHPLTTAVALGYLKPSDDLRCVFEKYFENGLNIRESISFHEATLRDSSNIEECLANASLNPKRRTVEHWFRKWRKLNFGPQNREDVHEVRNEEDVHGVRNGEDVHGVEKGEDVHGVRNGEDVHEVRNGEDVQHEVRNGEDVHGVRNGKDVREVRNGEDVHGVRNGEDLHEEDAVVPRTALKIHTHDMHTGGEPLRIIRSGFPELKGSTVLEKREYAKNNLDHIRKLLMNEPRGHKDMYGAILEQKEAKNEFFTLFIHNEGYSSMCGHGVIALGRYVVDFGLVSPTSPTTEVVFDCPCGPVKASVDYHNGCTGLVSFESVPAFVYRQDILVDVPSIGMVVLDIAFGGAFYAIIPDKNIGLDLKSSSLAAVIEKASAVTEAVKEQIPICHPESEKLSFLYGTIVTDGRDNYSDGPSSNICVFADKQVDRSPTGSGVTARIAIQIAKGLISLNQEKEFKSLIDTSFIGKAVRTTSLFNIPCVIVEVSGMAYHTGDHVFYMEDNDVLDNGFQLPR